MHSTLVRDTDLTNSGNRWSSGGAMNLSAGGNIALTGAQINSQGFSANAGGNYSEQAAYDVHERVNNQSIRYSGPGTYIADSLNNTTWLATGGQAGGRTETARTENHIDATRTAVVTHIDAGAGTVSRNAGGNVLIEGSVVSGAVVNPVTAGGHITAVAAVDTHHVEDSISTSTIRWQHTDSSGSIQQTLHMPEIHGTIPAGMSAYQGAGGVSVQLPAGSSVRASIEQLAQQPGNAYLRDLGNRSNIDWQRVQALSQNLDFSRSGLTREATIAVIIVVSILTYGAASTAGGAAATATGSSAVGAAVTAGTTSLASTAAVSLINHQGDIGATLQELGSGQNMRGLLLTMATAGLSQGILSNIPLEGGGTLASVNASSSPGLLLARNTVQGITSAVLESAVMGTSLEDALQHNLQSALINTVAAQGANTIGDAHLNDTSRALAHALLGCAVGAANAGGSAGCAPGAAGAAIGEIVAGLYGNGQNLGGLEEQLSKDPNNAALRQQVDEIRNTVTELARLSGAGAALLIGGDASSAQIAMGTASNAAVNNFLNHAQAANLSREMAACNQQAGGCDPMQEQAIRDRYIALSNENISAVQSAIVSGNAQEVQRLLSTAATAQEVTGLFGSRADEQIFVGRQNNVNNYGSVYGDARGSDVALAQQVQAFRTSNCQGISSSACDVRVEQALDDRATRSLLLAGATAALPLAIHGASRIINGIASSTVKPTTPPKSPEITKPPQNGEVGSFTGADGSGPFGSAANGIYSDMKPMGTQFPELVGVNPHYIENAGPGVNTNCVSCANASQARLSGTDPNATASPSSGYANGNALLPSAPFGMQPETSVSTVVQQMISEGSGAVGVVLIKQPGGPSHVINVVNQRGLVYFVDTQMGQIVTLKPNLTAQPGLP